MTSSLHTPHVGRGLEPRPLFRTLAVSAALLLLTATGASAQGRGKGLTKHGNTPSINPSTNTAVAGAVPIGYRQFGSWLDDGSVMDPGTTWVSLSFGHYKTIGGNQNDFPVADASFGMSPRTQFGITVPHYTMNFSDGSQVDGLGDIYASVKIALSGSDSSHAARFALTPIAEINQDPVPGTHKFEWGLPLSVELHPGNYRVFGSTGFYSRGAVFASGALEIPVHERVLLTPSLSYSRSLRDDAAADVLGLSKTHKDVNVVAAYILSPAMAAFIGTGRTLSNADGSGTSFMLNGGVSFTFASGGAKRKTRP